MSFVRAALAISVLEALRPAAEVTSGSYATTNAGPRVYLERAGALDDLAEEFQAPVVVIYTNEDDGRAGDGAGPPYERHIELELLLSVVMRVRDVDELDAPSVLILPPTDMDLCQALNVLEGQARFALLAGPSGAVLRKLVRKMPRIRSLPSLDAEEGLKLAQRRLVVTCQVPDDCYAMPALPLPEGVERLPQPLRDVARALLKTEYADLLAASVPLLPMPPPLTGITLNIDLSRPADGSADVVVDIPIPQD